LAEVAAAQQIITGVTVLLRVLQEDRAVVVDTSMVLVEMGPVGQVPQGKVTQVPPLQPVTLQITVVEVVPVPLPQIRMAESVYKIL